MSFYTRNLMSRVCLVYRTVALIVIGVLLSGTVIAQLPTTFQKVEVVTGLKNAVNFEFAPDGRIFIVDRYGEIFIYKPATQTTVSAGVINVFHGMEDGLLAIEFDPQFSANNFVYIHYSDPSLPVNRVSRFVMNGDQINLASEIVMLQWTSDRNGYYHAAGDMDFDSDGNLYIAIGDNTNHSPYAALNETDPNQSAERSSSNTNDLRGKILRITPQTDGSYSIPEGNLFPGGVGGRAEIYVMGARNPYKIFVDKTNTDWLFWGEVGPDANVSGTAGPYGMDEINLVKSAGNYGWPYFSGKNEPYLNSYTQPNFYYDPARPVNLSKWNTGARDLPATHPSWLEFFHGCYLAGPRYYFNSGIDNPKKLPSDFHQGFFYFDFNTSKMWLVKMDASGNVLSNERFAENIVTGSGFIDLKIGPDGQLYILEYGAGCCPQNVASGKLVRVDFTGIDSNHAPVVTLSTNTVSGPLPLTVNFSSAGTTDPDGDPVTFEWDFESDGIIDSQEASPSFTYNVKGTFAAQLRVADVNGATSSKSVFIYPGNTAATFVMNYPPDGGMFAWDDDVAFDFDVVDQEDGSTADGSINCAELDVVPSFGHLNHAHDGIAINQCEGTFNLDPSNHDAQGQDNIFHAFKLSYTDNDGLTAFDQVTIYPKITEAEFYATHNQTKLINNTDVLGGGVYSVRALSDRAYISFANRNLQNINSITYRLASVAGATIEVRADSPTGTLLSSATIPVTGSLDRWTNVTTTITDPGGKHDLYFVFIKPGAINFVDLNTIEFVGAGVSIDNTPPEVYSIKAISQNEISIKFNERLNAASASAIANYTINNGIVVSSASLQDDRKTVILATSPISVEIANEITISNIRNESNIAMSASVVRSFVLDQTLTRINVGGPPIEMGGVQWEASKHNTGGATESNLSLAINGTTFDALYQTSLLGNFTMNIPVANSGSYDLILHFAELVYKNVGGRVFNVVIENNQLSLINYDIYSKVGYATATTEHFQNIQVDDGFLTIGFTGVVNNPKLSAVEVMYGTEAPNPSITILNPAHGISVAQPFDVTLKVEDWWIGNGSSHIDMIVDGVHAGDVFDTAPITFDALSPGVHTLNFVLVDANNNPTSYSDEVQVNVVSGSACVDNPFPFQWEEYVIGAELPYRAPQIIAADLDQDGYQDIVTGGWWFSNSGALKGVWMRHVIGSPLNNAFLVHDFDRDGDPDVLGTTGTFLGSQLAWAQNDGNGNFIIHTNIPENAGFPKGSTNDLNTFISGVAVGNFNNVQNIQVALVWNGSETTNAPVKMLTVPSDPVNATWGVNDIAPNAVGEAIIAVDLDRDGDLDLSQAKNWLRNNNGTWTTISTGITMPTYYEHHLFADFDRNGSLDGALTQIGENQDIFWFQVPSDPAQPWTKTTLGSDVDSGLSLDFADLDFDGDLDVITGEWKVEKRLIAFENDLCNSGTWIKHILHAGGTSGPDHHNGTQTADLDNDGDLDIISLGWDKRIPRIYINGGTNVAGNNSPMVSNALPDQNATAGVSFLFTFSSNAFTDVDGDPLIYTASLPNGGTLPSWLTFTSTTRTFTGTPPSGSTNVSIRVTAHDGKGGSASDEFSIIFPNVAPVVSNPIPDQNAIGGTSFNFTFDESTFTDSNGDALTYIAQLSNATPLPQWLAFDGATRTFAGNPGTTDIGVFEIIVIASDNLLTASDVFTYTVNDPSVNQPPVVANPISDQNASTGNLFSFTFALNTFSDPNGDALSYSALRSDNSALPGWLTFDASTRTFSGTPGDNDVGSLEIEVTATDGTEVVSEIFMMTVVPAGGTRINAGGPSMAAYSVSFDSDKNFTGGGTFANNNITDITGTAYDQLYRTERYGIFSYQVPVVNGEYVVKLHFAEIYFGATGGGAGGVGKRVFNVTGEGQALLTNFDIYAEAGAMAALIKEFKVTVMDGVLNLDFIKVTENPKVNAVEVVEFIDPNISPVVANPIPDMSFVAGSSLNFTFAENTFSDADGDVLTYAATLSDGSALPGWLTFDAGTRTFNGTPAVSDEGVYQIRVTASDGVETISDVFALSVEWNEAPIVANPIPDQSVEAGSLFTFTFEANVFTDPDSDPLTFVATLDNGNPLPAWLAFDANTRTFSGTPANGDAGTLTIIVTAADGEGGSVTDIFLLTVTSPNSPPVVANAIPDQTATSGVLFSFTFALNTFSDADSDPLTYTAALAGGAALPSWVSFSSATRTFSGTPAAGDVGVSAIDVTASDGKGGLATETFQLTVQTSPPAGTRINAGAASVTLADGRVFSTDFGYSGGGTYTNTSTMDIAGTTHDVIYRSERYNMSAYNLSVASGTYLLTLHFAEIWYGAPGGSTGGVGKRVFNVSAEGVPLLTNFDIYAQVGAMAAIVREFEVTVTDGVLNIVFGKVVQNPKISAIEIVPVLLSTNAAPVVANPIPDQSATTGVSFNFAFASNTFSDVDNDPLTYSATLSGGSALPSWLAFSSSTRTFSGTPTAEGTLLVDVTAADGKGGSVTDTYQLTVTTSNSPPVVSNAIPDQSATSGAHFDFAFAENTFSDPDNDPLTFSASLSGGAALPAWLSFSPSTRTFSGTPASSDAGTVTIDVTASDGNGGSATDTYALTVTNPNSPPVVANAIPDQTATAGTAFTFTFALNTFSDPDGDALTYSAGLSGGASLPAWLTFSASTRTFSGTPGGADVGIIVIDVTALDDLGGVVTESFQLTVQQSSPPEGTRINSGSNAVTLADGRVFSKDFAYSGGGSYTNTSTADITGTTDDVIYRSERYALSAYNVSLASGTYLLTLHFAEIWFGAPGGSTGGVGTRVFSVSAEGVPLLTRFDIYAEVGAMAAVVKQFEVTVTDGTLNIVFTKVVQNPKISAIEIVPLVLSTNTAPVVANPIPDQTATSGTPFSFAFAQNTFSDADNDPLTYNATLDGGSALPSWLTFSSSTRTFSGTPASADAGTLMIDVTASDGRGGSVTDTYALTVTDSNSPPVVANAIPDQTATSGTAFSFTFALNTFSDADGDALTYQSALSDGAALPAWLTFSASTRTFSGTPASTDAGTLSIDVTASDGNGGSATDTYLLSVVVPNSPPVVANAIPDLVATAGTAFSFTFSLSTFTDADGDPLTYTAALAGGSALPAWLVFSSSNRNFSGTPTSTDVGAIDIEVTASDGKGGFAVENFLLTIQNATPPAGTRINSGSGAVTLADGRVFSKDFGYTMGGAYTTSSTMDIAGTTDDVIYRSERYNMTSYSVAVPSGTYLLTLHFAEIWFGAPGGTSGGVGTRVFNVSAEGVPLLTNFDIYALVGAMAAVVRQFEVTVTDGVLNIAFGKVVQNPKISAIEIVPITSSARLATSETSQNEIQTSLLSNEGPELLAFPNPFTTTTTLEYRPNQTGQISLDIVSLQGATVTEVYRGQAEAGKVYKFTFDGTDLPHGLYLARIITGEHARFVKLALTKRP